MEGFTINPEKYFIVAVDETSDMLFVSRFQVTDIEQRMDDVFLYDGFPATTARSKTYLKGNVIGPIRALEPRDMETISYDELTDVIKE